MTEAIQAAYLQLLSVGLVWISLHCAGMCGPILVGLDVAGVAQGRTAKRGVLGVLTYQLGRAFSYGLMGAFAGLVGAGFARGLSEAAGYATLALGVVVVGLGVRGLTASRARKKQPTLAIERGGRPATWATRMGRKLSAVLAPLSHSSDPVKLLALGAAMALLPCMITFWVLGLAATTASPAHGALLMLLLVAMTTPVLVGVTLLPRVVGGRLRRLGAKAAYALLLVSGVWFVLVGSASLDLIPHAHVPLGEDYVLMFW